MKRLCCLLSIAVLSAAGAADIPEAVGNSGMGVNIHFVTGHEGELDVIAAAFSFVRMDFGWEGIEKRKGEYDWKGYEELVRNLEQRGLRAIFILDYSNPLYEEAVTSPNPIDGVKRKARLHRNIRRASLRLRAGRRRRRSIFARTGSSGKFGMNRTFIFGVRSRTRSSMLT